MKEEELAPRARRRGRRRRGVDAARAAAEAEAPPSPPRPGRPRPPSSPKQEADAKEARDLDLPSSSKNAVGSFGATSGVWCWEWEARRVASGDVGVGLVAAGHDATTALGGSKTSPWCYRSCGALAGRGGGAKCAGLWGGRRHRRRAADRGRQGLRALL